jgi:hypothetical protein
MVIAADLWLRSAARPQLLGPVCESRWLKMIGKPCAGKLHAWFDEGELEIGPHRYYASSLLYPSNCGGGD